MKALTIYQPWATLIMLGEKLHETRGWNTTHRGPLAIHAGKKGPEDFKDLCATEPYRSVLEKHSLTLESLPRGVLLGHVELVDCKSADLALPGEITDQDRSFGNYAPGRFYFVLRNPTALVAPIPLRGFQGLFDVPDLLFGLRHSVSQSA